MSTVTARWKSANQPWVPIAVLSGVVLLAAALAVPTHRGRQALTSIPDANQVTESGEYIAAPSQEFRIAGARPVSVPVSRLKAADLQAPAAPQSSVAVDRKMVRTCALELTVQSPAEAAEQIRLMAESMGGYLERSQIGGPQEAPVANLTIRVPAAQFENAKSSIGKLAARVESEKSDAQDATRQYVDMEARLRNLGAEEAQYLTIMKSAYKVDDLLSVSQKLSEVRGEIEQQQAEFQTLSKQVETVAITVSLRAVADAQVLGLNWRPLHQLKVAARDGLDAMADYASTMAAILFYVPVILAWSLTILLATMLGWRTFRWVGRRFFAWPGPGVAEKATDSV